MHTCMCYENAALNIMEIWKPHTRQYAMQHVRSLSRMLTQARAHFSNDRYGAIQGYCAISVVPRDVITKVSSQGRHVVATRMASVSNSRGDGAGGGEEAALVFFLLSPMTANTLSPAHVFHPGTLTGLPRASPTYRKSIV